jgi:hypothetical protein
LNTLRFGGGFRNRTSWEWQSNRHFWRVAAKPAEAEDRDKNQLDQNDRNELAELAQGIAERPRALPGGPTGLLCRL